MRARPTKEQKELAEHVDQMWEENAQLTQAQWELLKSWRALGDKLAAADVSHGKVMSRFHLIGYELHDRLGFTEEALRQHDASDATFPKSTPVDLAESAAFKFSYCIYKLRDQQKAAAYLEAALEQPSSAKVKKAILRWISGVLEDHQALLFNARLVALIAEAYGVRDLPDRAMLGSELKTMLGKV